MVKIYRREIDSQKILKLHVPNKFVAKKINSDYLHHIKLLVFKFDKTIKSVQIVVNQQSNQIKQPDFPLQADSNSYIEYYLFDTYISRNSIKNYFKRISDAIINGEKSKSGENPIFLYGNTGVGKTHLLHALGNEIIESNCNRKVFYMHSASYIQFLIQAIQNNRQNELLQIFNNSDLLMIDDVQFYAYKERSSSSLKKILKLLLRKKSTLF